MNVFCTNFNTCAFDLPCIMVLKADYSSPWPEVSHNKDFNCSRWSAVVSLVSDSLILSFLPLPLLPH